jgi:hypothetical protein
MQAPAIILWSALGMAALPPIQPRPAAASNVWVEYTVTGDVEAAGRDEDLVMCGMGDEGFQARALGDWKIDIETDQTGFGSLTAAFSVTAPEDVIPLIDADLSRGYRLEGSGSVKVADAGKDPMGFSLVTAEFSAQGLESPQGKVIDIEGRLSCAVFQGRERQRQT